MKSDEIHFQQSWPRPAPKGTESPLSFSPNICHPTFPISWKYPQPPMAAATNHEVPSSAPNNTATNASSPVCPHFSFIILAAGKRRSVLPALRKKEGRGAGGKRQTARQEKRELRADVSSQRCVFVVCLSVLLVISRPLSPSQRHTLGMLSKTLSVHKSPCFPPPPPPTTSLPPSHSPSFLFM